VPERFSKRKKSPDCLRSGRRGEGSGWLLRFGLPSRQGQREAAGFRAGQIRPGKPAARVSQAGGSEPCQREPSERRERRRFSGCCRDGCRLLAMDFCGVPLLAECGRGACSRISSVGFEDARRTVWQLAQPTTIMLFQKIICSETEKLYTRPAFRDGGKAAAMRGRISGKWTESRAGAVERRWRASACQNGDRVSSAPMGILHT